MYTIIPIGPVAYFDEIIALKTTLEAEIFICYTYFIKMHNSLL
ncbi:hypothetical protein [Polaribacter sp. WD7]|nr:hypothetical protein [Polaribacter sp. WD7]